MDSATNDDVTVFSRAEFNRRPSQTFRIRIEDLERSLAQALREYRTKAEDALFAHLDALESTESAHQLEIAKLRAENTLLRESAGLKKSDGPELFQTVFFEEKGGADQRPAPTSSTLKRGKTTNTMANGTTSRQTTKIRTDDEPELNFRRAGERRQDIAKGLPVQQQQPGGSWQQFVAWVPNGAALQQPEPWQPLPSGAVSPPSPGSAPPLLGVVPGSVEEPSSEKKERKEKEIGSESGTNSSGSSSDGGKETFEVLEIWQATTKELNRLKTKGSVFENESGFTRDTKTSEDEAFAEGKGAWCFIIHPHSKKRIFWDLMSLTMVIYDMFMIPFSLFTLPANVFLEMMDWTTRLFWTLDMAWSVSTGVVKSDGKVEFALKKILRAYARTWLTLDILIVGSDWTGVLLSTAGTLGQVGGIARVFRIVRVVRLLRLVKMQEVIAMLTDRFQSDGLSFFVSVLKLVLFIVCFSHVIGCIWWSIGDQEATVVQNSADVLFTSLDSQYLMALHWTVAQFAGGNDEILPANSGQRCFSVVVAMLVFIGGVMSVSTLTSNMTQGYIIGGSQARQMATLRKYLKQNNISSQLSLRLQRSAKHAVSGELTQDSVELLQVVSEPLRVEMHFEMYKQVLCQHPFFNEYTTECPQVMRRVCHYAMSTLLLSKGDILFSNGDVNPTPKMYFIFCGHLEYDNPHMDNPATVHTNQYLSEAALWTHWKHRGTLMALDDCKIAMMDAKKFQEIATKNKIKSAADFNPKLYASEFVKGLCEADEVSDMPHD
eukprot:gnl/TRDRNA2_/TRDRNA2_156074_c1_seq2.p1 gnl/TRDRNA2_/TRDRNA2_156074_c1~~gnl/TRDRNA2_/TRDRNA2_156074_c1_seq2.p1  ORF type:complete len:773 (-),score=152.04 gnl/TRDRNA2_/TRDRNA2_156074_c1_seq2:95-2413(-)